ncbi:hypothetical protein [Nocardia sp. NPDC003183]
MGRKALTVAGPISWGQVKSSALLASEFREFGASAMVWDRESILDMMADDGACLSRAAHGGVSGAVFLLPVQISVLG